MLNDNQKALILLAIAAVAVIYYIFPGQSLFHGSHTMYEFENSSGYGFSEFCRECHTDIVEEISVSTAHNSTNCICHGYNPNVTVGGKYNVNLTHNLTKNAYCTNCHTRYDDATGDLNITDGTGKTLWVPNQSAHYIYYNASNASLTEEIYNRSWNYFNRSFGGLPE